MSIFDSDTLSWDSLPDAQQTAYEWDILREPKSYNPIADANNLYDAMLKARKNTAWKESVQTFCWEYLRKITIIQTQLDRLDEDLPESYTPDDGYEFMLNERGRMRPICGQTFRDRVVSHSLNDVVLVPAIIPHLIYDNTASIKNRGVDMARRRLRAHMTRFYSRNGTNIGYIRLKDQSKYYDNIRHDTVYEQICRFTDNTLALKLVRLLLSASELDVSYMTDEEFCHAMETRVDRVSYREANHPKIGQKMLKKGMNVGDQFSQTAGILYPYRVDSMAKHVQGSLYYARYMDDSYDIDTDISQLRKRAKAIDEESYRVGMFTNERKSCIMRLDKGFTYLQHYFKLMPNGTILERLRPKAITRLKRRLKKLKPKVDSGMLPLREVLDMYRSWEVSKREYLSYPQVRELERLILKLYGRNAYEYVYDHHIKWKCA